jgi:hypothetical protein
MLRTNSKKFRENLNAYVLDAMEETMEELELKKSITNVYECLYNDFKRVEGWQFNKRYCYRFDLFCEYMSGLPHGFTYYYGCAVETLGDLLEETEEEKNKFTQSQAEKRLSSLIYREMIKNVFKKI